jgi:hypothetical protein
LRRFSPACLAGVPALFFLLSRLSCLCLSPLCCLRSCLTSRTPLYQSSSDHLHCTVYSLMHVHVTAPDEAVSSLSNTVELRHVSSPTPLSSPSPPQTFDGCRKSHSSINQASQFARALVLASMPSKGVASGFTPTNALSNVGKAMV